LAGVTAFLALQSRKIVVLPPSASFLFFGGASLDLLLSCSFLIVRCSGVKEEPNLNKELNSSSVQSEYLLSSISKPSLSASWPKTKARLR
jgi:hypothetical protein